MRNEVLVYPGHILDLVHDDGDLHPILESGFKKDSFFKKIAPRGRVRMRARGDTTASDARTLWRLDAGGILTSSAMGLAGQQHRATSDAVQLSDAPIPGV